MAEPNKFSDITGIDELTTFLDRYCMEFMTPDCKFDPVVQTIMDMSHEGLVRLSCDDCYAYSFKLNAYCIFLRKDMDKALAKIAWCEDLLNGIVGRRWKERSEYMKYEVKRKSIIADDPIGDSVEKMRIYLSGAVGQVERKIENVKKMADILQDSGKRKSYDR